jgi:uncharacterized membrane protein
MLNLTYYYRKIDSNRLEFRDNLKKLCQEREIVLVEICIDNDKELVERYEKKTPTINVGPYLLSWPFAGQDLEIAINSAQARQNTLIESGDKRYQKRIERSAKFSSTDKFSLFFSKHFAIIVSSIIALFVLLPFLTPVLENNGFTNQANIIYKIYSGLCHQLAFRSFFLFGEQPFYPRELAHLNGLVTYESAVGQTVNDLDYAKKFTGNSKLGYKVALCERDVAIYGSIAGFGFLFAAEKKKIKKLPWYLWFIFAVMPIAIDGFSQIPGLSSGWPVWLPIRESTPLLRVITGVFFGAGTGWYMFPLMEESMRETRILLTRKKAILLKLNSSTENVND